MAKRLSEKVIFETKLFKIKDIDIEFSSGKKVTYQSIEKSPTALIVPITADNKVILIREYFYAIDERQISLPKGRIDEGMDALATANKELQEEIGFKAGKLDKLGVLTIAPGYYTQRTHVFLARDLSESKLPGDEDEEIEVLSTPLDKVDELIESGQITEARVIAALYLARRFLNK